MNRLTLPFLLPRVLTVESIDEIVFKGKHKVVDERKLTKFATVYMLYNTVNEKKYIGQTWDTAQGRRRSHKYDAKSDVTSRPICRAIRKYGIEKFEALELSYAHTQEDLDAAEDFWIIFFGTLDSEKGYNVRRGGQGQGQRRSRGAPLLTVKGCRGFKTGEYKHTPEGRIKCGNGSRGKK